jgi:hypothetical protein
MKHTSHNASLGGHSKVKHHDYEAGAETTLDW